MKAPLKILAVDDQHFYLKGIAECFRALPFVGQVETCNTYESLKIKLLQFVPDIVFLNLHLSADEGFTICREITMQCRDVFVAVVAQYESKKVREQAFHYGAGAYFIKNCEPEVFTSFLANFKEERIEHFYYYPTVTKGQAFKKDNIFLFDLLTNREKEVLTLLVNGLGHREIEKELGIRYETIKTHRTKILQKLELKNVAELVKFSISNHVPGSRAAN